MDTELDEAPPLLVTTNDEAPNLVDAKLGHVSLAKVPITIVTGAYILVYYLYSLSVHPSVASIFIVFRPPARLLMG